MRTVKEVSELTGISVRTLHYYDEIGLLNPTKCSDAGYRLYDDKALKILQQILFFKEFDLPLKVIKSIMDNPELDRNQILKSQQKILELKMERLKRLVSSIDDILRGDNKMDFEVFSEKEIEEMYASIIKNMSPEQLEAVGEQYGGPEGFRKHFLKNAAGEKAQKNFQKVAEWYGDKDAALNAASNPDNSEIFEAYQNRLSVVQRKLADRKGADVTSFEVKEIVGEYDFVSKQLFQMKDVTGLMLDMAAAWRGELKTAVDAQYGDGAADFMAAAVAEFYQK